MLAIVTPGQGAQEAGFLAPWLTVGDFADRLAYFSGEVAVDLAELGSRADAGTMRDTALAQPLLLATALSSVDALFGSCDTTLRDISQRDRLGSSSSVVLAGHSVGEVAAACLAGVLTPRDAAVFVRERGKAMANAAATTETTMAVVLGGKEIDVLTRLEDLGLVAANFNGAGQIVAAGAVAAIRALRENPPARAYIMPMPVAGAFHTDYMAEAIPKLRERAVELTPSEPTYCLLSSLDGRPVTCPPRDYLNRLVSQLTLPVRWDLCQGAIAQAGVTGLLELPPAGTLTGLARRYLPGIETFALNSPDQIDDARLFIRSHTTASTQTAKWEETQ